MALPKYVQDFMSGKNRQINVIEGVIFNIDYIIKFRGNRKIPVIRMYVKRDDGKTCVVYDSRFRPYFLVELDDDADFDAIREKILALDGVVAVEEIDKKKNAYTNKRLAKVIVDIPPQVKKLRNIFRKRKILGVITAYEDDILFPYRYAIDNGVPLAKHVRIPIKTYSTKEEMWLNGKIEETGKEVIPPYKVMSFDIESLGDEIIIIGCVYGEIGRKEYDVVLFTQSKEARIDERAIIARFVNFIKRQKPDIIVTYNGDRYDWIQIMKRAKMYGIKVDIGFFSREPQIRRNGIVLEGIVNVDVYNLVVRDTVINKKTLKNVSEVLGVMKREERMVVPYIKMREYWNGGIATQFVFKQYCLEDALATYKLFVEKFSFISFSVSKIVNVSLEIGATKTYGVLNSYGIMKRQYEQGYIIGTVGAKDEKIEGAYVVDPKPGQYRNVYCLDFKSLYPSIIIRDNYSFETYVDRSELEKVLEKLGTTEYSVSRYDENVCFVKKPEGILARFAREYLEARAKYKYRLKKMRMDDPEYPYIDAIQYAFKRLANALYGMTGNEGRYFFPQIGNAITAAAREAIHEVERLVEEKGYKVIYGDTDSVYIHGIKTEEEAKELIEIVKKKLNLELEIDYIIDYMYIHGKKKKYFFVKQSGELVVKGLEIVRGDSPDYLKDAMKEIIMKLADGKVEEAKEIAHKRIMDLYEGRFEVDDLMSGKTLTKDPGEYADKENNIHVVIALREEKLGRKIMPGDTIYYIVGTPEAVKQVYGVKRPDYELKEKKSLRGIHIDRATEEHVDVNHYAELISNALARLLSLFGVTKDELMSDEISLVDAISG